MAMTVRLFIKPYCSWCHKAVVWLNERGIQYKKLDVIADSKAFTEMINLSGQRFAPVIEVNGRILADFGPDELEAFWKQFEATDRQR
jgi:glutaredoxin 3